MLHILPLVYSRYFEIFAFIWICLFSAVVWHDVCRRQKTPKVLMITMNNSFISKMCNEYLKNPQGFYNFMVRLPGTRFSHRWISWVLITRDLCVRGVWGVDSGDIWAGSESQKNFLGASRRSVSKEQHNRDELSTKNFLGAVLARSVSRRVRKPSMGFPD